MREVIGEYTATIPTGINSLIKNIEIVQHLKKHSSFKNYKKNRLCRNRTGYVFKKDAPGGINRRCKAGID